MSRKRRSNVTDAEVIAYWKAVRILERRVLTGAVRSWAEIACYLGMSYFVVKRRGQKALGKLRTALEDRGVTKDVWMEYVAERDGRQVSGVRHGACVYCGGLHGRNEGCLG